MHRDQFVVETKFCNKNKNDIKWVAMFSIIIKKNTVSIYM